MQGVLDPGNMETCSAKNPSDGGYEPEKVQFTGKCAEVDLVVGTRQGKVIYAIGVNCEEICAHGVHFEDKWENVRMIIPDGDTFVSFRPARKYKEVRRLFKWE